MNALAAISWRLGCAEADARLAGVGDLPRTRQFIARAKGGMRGLSQIDFGDEFDSYGDYVDYGGVTFDQAEAFLPWDGTVMLEQGATDYDPFYEYGEQTPDIGWPADEPVWNWGAPSFEGGTEIRGEGGTVTSEGVGAGWPTGGGLSMPSWDQITGALKTGVQVYSQIQQQELQREMIERGQIPRTMYPQTMLPGVPRTTTGTQPMVWNPATNRYEPARASGQLIPGVSNTMLAAGAAGVAALLLLGKKGGRK
jgi:hypothetical protein